eukprot:1427325-Lingulodinium_polyedra.AAC.1
MAQLEEKSALQAVEIVNLRRYAQEAVERGRSLALASPQAGSALADGSWLVEKKRLLALLQK